MSQPDEESTRPDVRPSEELAKIPYEPLLPVEKKLIAVSLALGLVLLAVLVFVSYAFFPAPQ